MDSLKMPSEVEEKLTCIKEDILNDVNVQLTSAIEHLMSVVKHAKVVNGASKPIPPTKSERRLSMDLPDKEFVLRNSALTDLWSVPHVSSVYNICTAMFLVCIIMSTLFYISDPQSLVDDLELLFWAAGKIYSWLSIWLGMKFSCILVLYPMYSVWANTRIVSPNVSTYDGLFLALFVTYLGLFLFVPVKMLLLTDLPPVSSIIVLSEQIRLILKSYAFVRENLPKTLKFKPHQDGSKDLPLRACPKFQNFLYFLFIPTIVYRDSYPRTLKICWEKVLWSSLQILATILAAFIAFQRFVIPIFQNVGLHYLTPTNFVVVFSGSIVVGALSMFCGFYGILHCWMNAFAEMLRFGDRMFYEDWWNCTTFSQFYRRWNRVIHDWIYAYVYRDLLWLFGKKNQSLVLVSVALFSALIHEYIIIFALRFFLPVMFILYSFPGIIVHFATRNKTSGAWNVFMWMSVVTGWGIMIFLYSTEWYARKNCPTSYHAFWDNFIPRLYTCNILKFIG